MYQEIENFVKSCDACIAYNNRLLSLLFSILGILII